MKHPPERDWMIVAPWWHWPAAGPGPVTPDPQKGRLTRPEIQKYDSPNLVNDFIAKPQKSLKFIDEDLVHARRAAAPIPLGLGGKPRRFSNQEYAPDGTDTRKLFLDTHKRFYALCCGLHCDGPGFPKVGRAKVCQAGFVIRRRTTKLPTRGVAEVKPMLATLAAGRANLARVNQLTQIENLAQAAATGSTGVVASAKLESLLKARGSLQALLQAEKQRLDDWVARLGVVPQVQGWFKSAQGFDKIGAWAGLAQTQDETPADIGLETSYPLYPLIPDQNQPQHAGQFGTIYFGLLPTGSSDTDRYGMARFDEKEFYEVRCWVKRHTVAHDADQTCPCPDGMFWSLPTRPFKLAPHFDLVGTSHRPVTVQLPDLNDLAAQTKPALGVAFAKPKGSLRVGADKNGKAINQGFSAFPEICSFPIPLITIVASFLFELTLPIVTFLFQLWWMLSLKFCIPPEIHVAAGLTAEIALDGSLSIKALNDLDASIEVEVDAKIKADFGADAGQALIDHYAPIALANMQVDIVAAADPATAPSADAGLEFDIEVSHA